MSAVEQKDSDIHLRFFDNYSEGIITIIMKSTKVQTLGADHAIEYLA